jgi:hypothetical protein
MQMEEHRRKRTGYASIAARQRHSRVPGALVTSQPMFSSQLLCQNVAGLRSVW